PTLKQIKESTTPVFSRFSFGILAWVILAGCPAKLSTPPKLSAKVNTLNLSTILIASSKLLFFLVNDNISLKYFIFFLATLWFGCSGNHSQYTFSIFGCFAK